MKSLTWLVLLFPFAISASEKQASLRIETLHPDGTKTVKVMVPSVPPETKRLVTEKAIQQEKASRLLAREKPVVLTQKHRYLALIVAQIQRNWFVDDSMRGKECRVNMLLDKDGSLTSATVLHGDQALCSSALSAIKKGSPYPMSTDPDVYDALRNITPTLRPELR